MEKNFKLPSEIEFQIKNIAKTASGVALNNLNFDYKERGATYTICLNEYDEYWEIIHKEKDVDNRIDVYKLSFDWELQYVRSISI